MIFCDRASDLLQSVMHHVLHSDVQSLIIVSPDVSGFLHQVWGHFFPDGEDSLPADRRLFFQPNDVRDKESIDTFVDNLSQNSKLRLHHVVLLTEEKEREEEESGHPSVHYYLMRRLRQANLLLPHSHILITSQSVRRFFTMCQQRNVSAVRHGKENDDDGDDEGMRLKWMLIGNTSGISINKIPRLVSSQGKGIPVLEFLQHWLSFVAGACLAMNPDYISGIIIATLGSQTSDSFFIYGTAVR